MAQNQLLCNF